MSSRAHRILRVGGLTIAVLTAAGLALSLHLSGHTQGDDFALYLRQARSVLDGDVGAVVADNRFAVLNSDTPFSPIAYPWGWPLLLSPFVHVWGLDLDRLKLVQVAVFCAWLVMVHGIVRRRLGDLPAIATLAVLGTSPLYLAHTDQLLSEIAFLFAVSIVLWWYDRIRRGSTLLSASALDLVVLGALVMMAFNVRREGVVLLGVVAGMQLWDIARGAIGNGGWQRAGTAITASWRPLGLPYMSFAISAIAFQLLLPTHLLPNNGGSPSFIDDRLREAPATIADQLGLGNHTGIGVALLVVAVLGAVLGVRRRPELDLPLLLLLVSSSLAVSTHLREVERYWFQVTPWVLYFATVAVVEASRAARSRRVASVAIAVVPLFVAMSAHANVLRTRIPEVARARDAGAVQSGPTNPNVAPVYASITAMTPPDAIIAYYPARTMTLITERRAFQTTDLERIATRADYFVQRRDSTYWQPDISESDAEELGFEEVWSNSRYVIWQIP